MITKSIFKAYDVRGIYPKDVNADSVTVIGKALLDMWNSGTIVVAHDGRHGSPELANVLIETIKSETENSGKKFDVTFVGLSTTPMFYFLVNHLKAAGGAIITASHNPKEYNGLKPVRAEALPITGTELLKVIEEKGYGN